MNKVVVIAGANGGLGKAAARAFAQRGDSLVLLSRNQAGLDSLAHELNLHPERILTIALNLLDAKALHAAADTVSAKFGAAHILLDLIGGWTGGTAIPETSPDDLNQMLDQHVRGTFNLFQAFVPLLVKSGWGRLMTISVPGVTHPAAKRGAYLAAKSAQEALFFTLAEEFKEAGITSNVIVVNSIDEENQGRGTPLEEIVAAMLYLSSDQAARINGIRLPVY